MKYINISVAVILIALVAAGLALYPRMPGKMHSHWNAAGSADGQMPKAWALFLVPGILALLLALFNIIPALDPLKDNIKMFRGFYGFFVLVFSLFLAYVHALTLLWNTGARFDMIRALAPAMGILFYAAGMLLGKARRNWFIGIRTPWTMSSDQVWDMTHKRGGRLFRLSGILAALGAFSGSFAVYIMLGPVLLSSLYLVFYSWLLFSRQKTL